MVPAHNEEHLVGACLFSLAEAAQRLRATVREPPDVSVIVVLDSCTDGTAAQVATHAGVRAITVRRHRVGWARRSGAEYALAQPGPRMRWLASTDADSTVPPDWLIQMTALAAAGADLVLGTVEPAPGLNALLLQRYRSGYHHVDGHRHVHGANLGISASAYRMLGGWPPVASQEDAILARRAEAAGLRIERTATIPVRTSSRMVGRAPGGFAAHLAALADASS